MSQGERKQTEAGKVVKQPQPISVLRKSVPSVEVGKEYLKAEFDRVFPGVSLRKKIDNHIDNFPEKRLWRVLEAMSLSYRLNGVFWFVSDSSYAWNEEVWSASSITYTGTFRKMDEIARENGNDFVQITDSLSTYFKEHPDDDPKGLNQFRPNDKQIVYDRIILRVKDSKASILDGTNRLVKLLLSGETKIRAFVGRPEGEGKMRVGDSTFWLLKRFYEKAQDEEMRKAILKVASGLENASVDGKTALETYWPGIVKELEKHGF